MSKQSRYERFMAKEQMKEARHQAKLDAIRRKQELSEVKNKRIRVIGDLLHKNEKLLVIVLMTIFMIVMYRWAFFR